MSLLPGRRLPGTAALLLAALLQSPAQLHAQQDEARAVFERVSGSVVTVIGHAGEGRRGSQGSGVLLEATRIVTNCHVIRDADRIEVVSGPATHPARWTLQDPSRDLCLLETQQPAGRPAGLRDLSDVVPGERVHAVGNPLGFGLSVSSGLVTAFATLQGERVLLASAVLSPGSSGGGLFDAQGRLVGITTGMLGPGQGLNIALPADWARELSARGRPPVLAEPPPSPEPRWLERSQALEAAGAWQELEGLARDWIAAQPGAARARIALAASQLQQGRIDAAEHAAREALRLDERMAHAWHYLGVVLHRAGRHAQAEQAMDRALELLPASPEVHLARAGWRIEQQRLPEALAEAERAVAIEPGDHRTWAMLGDARSRLGLADEAIRAYRAALRLNERDVASREALARLLAGGGKADAAHRTLAERSGARADARTLVALGVADFNRQRYALAEDAFRKAVASSPELAEGWEKLGMALARMKRDEDAATALDRALSLEPRLVEARIERAALRARRGDRPGALADARFAAESASDDPRAWRSLASNAVAAGDATAALSAYHRLDTLGGSLTADLAAWGDLLGRSGRRTEALRVFDRAESADPRNDGLLVNIAAFHGRSGALVRAQEYLERALAVAPRNVDALSSQGYLRILQGAPQEAVTILERAVAIDPERANAWINLGHAHLRNRNAGRAIAALEKGLALAPESLDAHLYAAQAFLAAREPGRARRHSTTVLVRQPDLAPALSISVLSHLMEGDAGGARPLYQRLRRLDPQAARQLRSQALAGGLTSASSLPD